MENQNKFVLTGVYSLVRGDNPIVDLGALYLAEKIHQYLMGEINEFAIESIVLILLRNITGSNASIVSSLVDTGVIDLLYNNILRR